jgi:hypothetical protein
LKFLDFPIFLDFTREGRWVIWRELVKFCRKRDAGQAGMVIAKTPPDEASFKPLVLEFFGATKKRVIRHRRGGSTFV